jgi:hypothetical protein
LALINKIAIWTIALYCLWYTPSTLAGTLTDRIAAYPNWRSLPQLNQHQGELTYPTWFEGTWQATSTEIEQIAPLAPDLVTPGFENNRQYINKPIEFTVRFVPTNPDRAVKISPLGIPTIKTKSSPQIVADRAFNGLNIAAAYLGAANVKSVKIDPQNPTKQLTQLTADRQLVSFVTAFDREEKPDLFTATELSQQVFKTTATIYLNTVETTTSYQFSPHPIPQITATQISAIYLSPQDPDYLRARDRPVAIYKYRLQLEPIDRR